MEVTSLPDDWIGLLAVLIIVGGPTVLGWITYSKKRDSDQKDQAAAPAMKEAEKRADWSTAVHTLAGELKDVKAVVEQLRVVAEQKYPMSLHIISVFEKEYPAHGVHIPQHIRADL